MPLPAARALCCICLRQDAATIANGITLRALEPRVIDSSLEPASKNVDF
jgi:hypothetical protein